MGMFDDLIPATVTATPTGAAAGMFDDLIPRIDFSSPDAEVRAAISKLPETARANALDRWADARVAKERAATSFPELPSPVRGLLGGTVLDEATAGIESGLNEVTGGSFGAPYDEALAMRRARDRAADAAHPVLSTAGQLAAGFVVPVPGLSGGGTALGRIARGAVAGTAIGGAQAFGAGEGGFDQRLEAAEEGAKTGAIVGTVLPAAAEGAAGVAPWASEGVAQVKARLPEQIGPDANEVANKIIAGRLQRSGRSIKSVADNLAEGQRAAQLNESSVATLPETIADTSNDMQRLTGAVYRTGGEAGETISTRLEARQKGPDNPYAPRANQTPQGQLERIIDDFDRALEVKTAPGARATATELIAKQKAKADELYQEARDQSEPFELQPVTVAWRLRAQQYQGPFRDKLVGAINLFDEPPGSFTRFAANTITRFDNAKKILDDMIEHSKGEFGKATNLTRELTDFKGDLLQQVHKDGKNPRYQEARDEFGTAAENLEAIKLGQKAFREDSETSVDTYRALTPAQQKLFRIGLRDGVRLRLATLKPGDNATLPFQQRRVRELLNAVIPRSKKKSAEFADRAERFGDLISREERMSRTRNMVLGNSATAMRSSDDAELAADALKRVMTGGRSWVNWGIELLGAVIQKSFGYRRDVAAALAHKLLDADPETRAATLAHIAKQDGPEIFSIVAQTVGRAVPGISSTVNAPAPSAALAPIHGNADDRKNRQVASVFGLISPAEAADAAEAPSDARVPFGDDGKPGPSAADVRLMQADADKERAKNALLSVGDTTIVPSLDELKDAGLRALHTAGDAAMAFGPQGEALGAPIEAMAPLFGSIGISPRATAAAATSDRLLSKPSAEQTLKALHGEVDDLIARGKRLGVEPGPMPDVPLSLEEKINALAFQRDSMMPRIEAREAALAARNAAAPPTSVPSVDGITPMNERADVMEALTRNPYTQAIPGRAGFPTKDEQADLAKQFFDEGGRLPDAAPWGRDMPETIRAVLSEVAARRGLQGQQAQTGLSPEALKAAFDTLLREAEAMRTELAQSKNAATSETIKAQLKQANLLLVELQQQMLRTR